jgi:subfamily B ATP-binding cassette protein MsbA
METTKKDYGLKWIFAQTKGTRGWLILFAVLTIVSTAVTLSTAYFIKLFVDIATGDLIMSPLRVGITAIIVLGSGGLVAVIASTLSRYISGKTERGLRAKLLNTIFTRKMVDISKQHTGELLTKLTIDVEAVSNCSINVIRNMVGGIASAIIAIVAMFMLDWVMALILLGLTPVLMLAMGSFTPFLKKASEEDKRNEELNRSLMQENLSQIMLVKTYFMIPKLIKRLKETYNAKLKSGMKLGKWEGLVAFTGELIAGAMFLVAMGIGAHFVLSGRTTIGNLFAIIQLINYVVMPVSNFAGAIAQISQTKASAERIGEIYELPSDTGLLADTKEKIDAHELTAKNVSFTYGTCDDDGNVEHVLNGVEAVFKKGSVTGLVGQSGSGKSTLLKLLIGLYNPQEGSIELSHKDGTLSGQDIMPQIAYVPPVDYLFSESVIENIVMSDDIPNMENARAAAQSANILDFIESLQEGFDTPIGESGGTVSSGQAQRLAIARALYKDAPVLVFDEPTANLDIDSVERFQSVIQELSKEKICIVVTHDVSTIGACDTVYVLEDGKVRVRTETEDPDLAAA